MDTVSQRSFPLSCPRQTWRICNAGNKTKQKRPHGREVSAVGFEMETEVHNC